MSRMQGYYETLDLSFNDQISSYRRLIQMDIDRTAKDLTPEIKQMMMRILFNFAKRNMEIAYCQGMNFICFFLIEMSFEEEEIFWIFCHLFESIMPHSYYVNMTPVLADIEILKLMMAIKLPFIYREITTKGFDLNFLLIPLFVTIFTNLKNNEVLSLASHFNIRSLSS